VVSIFYRRNESTHCVGLAVIDDANSLPVPEYTGFQPAAQIDRLRASGWRSCGPARSSSSGAPPGSATAARPR